MNVDQIEALPLFWKIMKDKWIHYYKKKHSAEQTDIKIFIYLLDCIFYPFRTFYAYLQNKIIIKIAYQMEMHFKYEVIISLSFFTHL